MVYFLDTILARLWFGSLKYTHMSHTTKTKMYSLLLLVFRILRGIRVITRSNRILTPNSAVSSHRGQFTPARVPKHPPGSSVRCGGEELIPNVLNRVIEVLQDAGVPAPIAQVLAHRHSEGRIQAAITYAKGYRGELLNKPGGVVSALQNGWKLPK